MSRTRFDKPPRTDALRGAEPTPSHRQRRRQSTAAQCPAHDDTKNVPGYGTRRDGAGTVLYCHAGCNYTDVLAALDLTPAGLFDEPRMRQAFNPTRDYRYPGGRVAHRRPRRERSQAILAVGQ